VNNKYFGEWSCLDDLCEFNCNRYSDAFEDSAPPVTEDELLHASYDCSGYEGQAFVLFERDGKLYEVNASHCSCYGLDGQWDPTETTWKAQAMRWCRPERSTDDAVNALGVLITSRLGN
jgi:hypothetical protein